VVFSKFVQPWNLIVYPFVCVYIYIYIYKISNLSGNGSAAKVEKVKLSLCVSKHRAMKMYGGSGGIAPAFLTLSLDGGERSASRSGGFVPRETGPGTH
jgi:hypothetical protein